MVVNQALIQKMNIQDPAKAIGRHITLMKKEATIVGVVQDFYTHSLKENISPVVIYNDKNWVSVAGLKVDLSSLPQTLPQIEKLWKETYPDELFEYEFLEDNLASYYRQEERLAQLFKVASAIAIFIGCLGLYGLISLVILQRTKEMRIRKVLGASAAGIVYLFCKEYILLILLAFLLATPVAYYLTGQWLQDFAARIPLGPELFLLAIIGTLFISLLTIGIQSLKAALANPVKSLRQD